MCPLDILFPSNHNIYKSSCGLCFWVSDLIINTFYWNFSIKAWSPKQRPYELLWMLLFDEKVYSWNIFQMCGGVNNILFLWLYVELVWIKKIVTLKLPVVTYVTGIFKKNSIIKSCFCHLGEGFWLADQQSQPIRSLQLFIIKKLAKKGKN